MKDKELKQVVIDYATNTSIKECSLLFEGIVSRDTVYKWVRQSQVLDYRYTKEQCLQEIKNYKKCPPSYDSVPTRNRVIHTFQPHFFHIEREMWKDDQIKKKIIENRKKYLGKDKISDREILRGFKISGAHIGYSHFSPLWLTKFIIDNNIKTIYDPCGGWGHRMIGCSLTGAEYIYNDKWDKTYNGCKKISSFLKYPCVMYNNDCMSFIPDDQYDCVFTCPPYGNIEIYNNSPIKNYNNFIRLMLQNSVKKSVKHIGIVINKTYKDVIVNNITLGFNLKDEIILGTTKTKSHLNKHVSKQEILLHFCKSN